MALRSQLVRALASLEVVTSPTALSIPALRSSYPYVWLRDNCQCPECVHPSTRQKLHKTSDIPLGIQPLSNGVFTTPEDVRITWDAAGTGSHRSVYHTTFLEQHSSSETLTAFHRDFPAQPWDAPSLQRSSHLFVPYKSLSTPTGLLAALNQLRRFGLVIVRNVPTEETSDAKCELRKLAAYFGLVRPTFYGETWDVKNIKNSTNIAYTNLDLGPHMDLLYFHSPPDYQILHCLANKVVGGTSTFVDAFHVANTLWTLDPAAFDNLATTPVAFHYINDRHHLHHLHPTIELSQFQPPASSGPPAISHISYSPPFQAPLPLDTPPEFYRALKKFADLVKNKEAVFSHTLREGDAAIFDNRRLLHARTAFQEREGVSAGAEGSTSRWLKGCYLDYESVLDRSRVISEELEELSNMRE